MTNEHLVQHISIDPNICFGKPCIRGTRIWVSLILDLLAAGDSIADILAEYPGLMPEDLHACIAYGEKSISRTRAMYDISQWVTRDPKIVGGEPVFIGTRVTLRTILASLAEGASVEQILLDFPTLSREQVWTAIAFAAASAQEDMPLRPLPQTA